MNRQFDILSKRGHADTVTSAVGARSRPVVTRTSGSQMSGLDDLRNYLDGEYQKLTPAEKLAYDNRLALMSDMAFYGECFIDPRGHHVAPEDGRAALGR